MSMLNTAYIMCTTSVLFRTYINIWLKNNAYRVMFWHFGYIGVHKTPRLHVNDTNISHIFDPVESVFIVHLRETPEESH